MSDQGGNHYSTRVETNRWESFTRLAFVYFADKGYSSQQRFENGYYTLVFTDEERDEQAQLVYEGSPPDMAGESLQQMQKFFEGSTDWQQLWREMLG